ncbi:MAG: NADH-quinone oxidoreductase subunit M [Gammaproteobacteria bacterium]|nr:NADH-quinone oxidoreductase subunit M [Gammaproteobacteria bacterium]
MLLGLPLAALLIWAADAAWARWVALWAVLLELLLAGTLLLGFDNTLGGFQFVERAQWIPTLHIHYLLGVDGISLLFLPLTLLLFLGAILLSWNSVRTMPQLYYTLLLLLLTTTLGIFTALDTMLFFLFWELSLIPAYFLISLWGIGPQRRFAATSYTLHMFVGGVPLLFGFVLLALGHGEATSQFDYPALLSGTLSVELQGTVFLLLLLGFAVKTAIFPLHTWLPTVVSEGPIALSAILLGLKLGAYGLLRFAVPLAPQAAQEYHWLLAGMGVFGILYGALLALAQSNLRGMLAFSSISHVGLVLLGLAAFSIEGVQGALFQLLNFTVISGGMMLIAGMLHQRLGSTEMLQLGGVANTMPLLAALFFLFGLASMGIPGTNGFPAELLLIFSALKSHTGAGLAALFGVVLGAGYLLAYYRRAFYGPLSHRVVATAPDLLRRELWLLTLFAVIILAGGLYPVLVLDTSRVAAEAWLNALVR